MRGEVLAEHIEAVAELGIIAPEIVTLYRLTGWLF